MVLREAPETRLQAWRVARAPLPEAAARRPFASAALRANPRSRPERSGEPRRGRREAEVLRRIAAAGRRADFGRDEAVFGRAGARRRAAARGSAVDVGISD